jgi:hypothetical protein
MTGDHAGNSDPIKTPGITARKERRNKDVTSDIEGIGSRIPDGTAFSLFPNNENPG